jgi:hypothetical protein
MTPIGGVLVALLVLIFAMSATGLTLGTLGYIHQTETSAFLAPDGNGSQLTNLNASNVSTGTLDTARLPAGVVFTDVVQSFTAQHGFAETTLTESDGIVVWDANTNQVAKLSISTSAILQFPTNVVDGFWYVLTVTISNSSVLSFGGPKFAFTSESEVNVNSIVQFFASNGKLNGIISPIS